MIAIIRTRAPFAEVEQEPYRMLQWVELFPERSFIWLTQSPDKIYKRYGPENFPIGLETYDMEKYFAADTFTEKAKILDQIITEKGITEVVTVQNTLSNRFSDGLESSMREDIKSIIAADNVPTFNTVRGFFEPGFIAYYLTMKLPNQHIYLDPQEGLWHKVSDSNTNKGRYFFYNNPRIEADYLPYPEWSHFKTVNIGHKKTRDFIFGITVKTSDRFPLYEQLCKIKSDKIDFLAWYPKKKIRTTVSRRKYFQFLEESKFTLIIPSYEIVDFSSIRFWESLTRGCVPFILDTCKWEQGFREYPQIGKIVGKELITTIEGLEDKINTTDHKAVLSKITATDDWKNLRSTEWYLEKAKLMNSRFTDTDKPQKISLF